MLPEKQSLSRLKSGPLDTEATKLLLLEIKGRLAQCQKQMCRRKKTHVEKL